MDSFIVTLWIVLDSVLMATVQLLRGFSPPQTGETFTFFGLFLRFLALLALLLSPPPPPLCICSLEQNLFLSLAHCFV